MVPVQILNLPFMNLDIIHFCQWAKVTIFFILFQVIIKEIEILFLHLAIYLGQQPLVYKKKAVWGFLTPYTAFKTILYLICRYY